MSGSSDPDTASGPAKQRCWRCGAPRVIGAACGRCGNDGLAPARANSLGQALLHGLGGSLRGLGYLNKNPKLWGWVVVPLIVNTLLCVGLAWYLATTLLDWMPDLQEAWPAWIDWLRVSLGWLLGALMWIVGVVAAFLATLLLASIVNSPFYDALSQAVEDTWLGNKDPGRPWSAFIGDVVRSLRASLSLAARYLAVMAVLFALSFTGIGAPLFLIAGFYYTGLSLVDLTLARKLYPGGQRARWGRRHWMLLMGLGAPVSFVPLLAPFGIVGATLAFLEDPDKH